MINHKKKANEFLQDSIEKKRDFQARVRGANTNFIQENKADARVWRDLDVVVKEEF